MSYFPFCGGVLEKLFHDFEHWNHMPMTNPYIWKRKNRPSIILPPPINAHFKEDTSFVCHSKLGHQSLIWAFHNFKHYDGSMPSAHRNSLPSIGEIMCEYSDLGHMSPRPPHIAAYYYIPHRSVYRSEKIRVGFDASAHSSSGCSLDNILLSRPTIRPDIFCIRIAFRAYKEAFKADITKMYRQVLVDNRDRVYQAIMCLMLSRPQPISC